jgi:large subunit ribosomal protein L24
MTPKITKGDTVQVIAGEDKGKTGEVQRVIRKRNEDGSYDPERVYVIVSGLKLVIRHQRRTGRVNTQTGRIEKEAPIHISNVMLLGSDGRPTRAGYQLAEASKERIDRRSGDALPKPTR